jgi:integrase
MAEDTWERTTVPGIYKREGARGRHYRVMYRDRTGRQAVRHFNRFEDAKRFKGTVTGKRPHDVAAGRRTLAQLYEAQGATRRYATETVMVRAASWRYLERWADARISKITPTFVDDILKTVTAPVMRGKVKALFSVMFAYALEQGWAETNPAVRPRKRRTRAELMTERGNGGETKRYLDHEELARLLDALPERYRALVGLMARIGLRPGEAYALRVGKFDSVARTLDIDTSVSGFTKTGEPRTLLLPSVIAKMLADHIHAFSDPHDVAALVFPTNAGTMIEPDNFRRRTFATAAKRAKIEGVSPNTCRHTAAAFAIATGANVYDVQRMLGHARPSITMDVYGSLWKDQHERFISRYDRAIRKATQTARG